MTAIIKASCPSCGELELTPSDVSLMVCTSHPEMSYYCFTCWTCRNEIRKPADSHVIGLLISGGVHSNLWHVPSEALEAHDGPAITLAECEAFETAELASLNAATFRLGSAS